MFTIGFLHKVHETARPQITRNRRSHSLLHLIQTGHLPCFPAPKNDQYRALVILGCSSGFSTLPQPHEMHKSAPRQYKRLSNYEQTKSKWTDVMLLLLELHSQYPNMITPLRGLIIITAHYNQFNGIKVTCSFLLQFPLGWLGTPPSHYFGLVKGFLKPFPIVSITSFHWPMYLYPLELRVARLLGFSTTVKSYLRQ